MEPSVDQVRLLAMLERTPHAANWWNPWYGDSKDVQERRNALVGHLVERSAAPILLVGMTPGQKVDPEANEGEDGDQTAMHIQAALQELDVLEKTVFWNLFPFHPHQVDDPEKSRDLDPDEEKEFSPLVNHFLPRRRALVLAVGRPTERGLKAIGVRSTYVCHPARNKHDQFKSDVAAQVERLQSEGLL